ncbi:uncharacterized protein TNCV_2255731 [Trichonephila clavipes]|nr:uncharacterized protein TNCV_2255731 [Trichonephila clavipes]
MYASTSSVNPTLLAHADTPRNILPRGGISQVLEEFTNFVQWIPGFQECDEEDAETWMACECGFQMLNDDKIVTSVQEEYSPVNDEMDKEEDNNNKSSKWFIQY